MFAAIPMYMVMTSATFSVVGKKLERKNHSVHKYVGRLGPVDQMIVGSKMAIKRE
jgi:hypothetical protein